jgi:cytochrome P450
MATDAAPATAARIPRPFALRFADDAERYGYYARMRRDSPVEQDAESGFWSVFRHADVLQVLSNPRLFSSDRIFQGPPPRATQDAAADGEAANARRPGLLADTLISADPPRHTQLRAIVSRAFTPRAVPELEPVTASLAADLLDRVVAAGRMEVMADLAGPLPVTVIAQLLGIPLDDREQFKRWSDDLIGSSDAAAAATDFEVQRRAQESLADYFRGVIAEKRARPADDLISALIAAEVDGRVLTESELLGFCALLLVAGHETTTNLIGNGFLCLLEHPEQMERLRADPALMPSAVEEMLRYSSPVQAIVRRAAQDVTVGGRLLPAGAGVVPWLGAANRDEQAFPDPERFDVGRTPNRQLAFGYGTHFCLGAPLARLEGRIVLDAMLRRLGEPELDPETHLEWSPGFIRGLRRLPVRFRPAP